VEPRIRGALISDTRPAEPAAVMEMAPGGTSRTAADRPAALTVRGARAACAMIHLTDGRHMRLIGF
jgi:two-component system phosphate regulon sensor histidine kinase PhoR